MRQSYCAADAKSFPNLENQTYVEKRTGKRCELEKGAAKKEKESKKARQKDEEQKKLRKKKRRNAERRATVL
jgi:hypothetical protein